MATSAQEIEQFILEELPDDFVPGGEFGKLGECITAIATGIYRALENLEDVGGSPPASGHQ